jgi:hypothetical protein
MYRMLMSGFIAVAEPGTEGLVWFERVMRVEWLAVVLTVAGVGLALTLPSRPP